MKRHERTQHGHIHIVGILVVIGVLVGLYYLSRYANEQSSVAAEVQHLRERVSVLEAKLEVMQRTR